MTGRVIEYFFTLQSPWSYVGHVEFTRVVALHGARIDYRPVDLLTVFSQTGGVPLAERHPARRRYRMIELQRWVARRGLPMHLHPRFWPFDAAFADRVVIAAGADAERLVPRLFSGIFERDENLADAAVVAGILREAGLDADAVTGAARSAEVASAHAANTALALERGAIGAPTYVLDGEIFWGQDRLPLLDEALASGRAPFTADA